MSANVDKSDSLPRVTRSMLRINSSDSLNQDSERPLTPTGRLRNAKKLESIDETTSTPTRRTTRAGSLQRTIAESTTPASPLRRVTRRMSNDNAITEVIPSPAKLKRASNKRAVPESDDDDVIFVNETIDTRTKPALRRVSVNVVKLEEVAEEEHPEIETNSDKPKENNENGELNKSAASTDELELRNRSISKSPGVNQRISISSNDVSSVQENSKDSTQNNDSNSMDVSAASLQKKSLELSKETANNSQVEPTSKEKEKSLSPSKSPKKKSSSQNSANGSSSDTSIKLDFGSDSLTRRQSSRKSLSSLADTISGGFLQDYPSDLSSFNSQKWGSPQKNSQENYTKNVIEPCSSVNEDDLVASDSEASNLVIQLSKSPQKDESSQEKENSISGKVHNENLPLEDPQKVNKLVEYFEKEKCIFKPRVHTNLKEDPATSLFVATVDVSEKPKEKENTANNENEVSIVSKDSGFSARDDDTVNKDVVPKDVVSEDVVPKDVVPEDVVSKMMEDFVPESTQPNKLKKTRSIMNKTQMNTIDMECDNDQDKSISNETIQQAVDMDITAFIDNKPSENKTKTWSQSVHGSSTQIDSLKKPETEVIHETSSKRKVISSDESEGENDVEKNEFIDDEAEVASDEESMTKSERDYLEQNEIVEDGESLGSQDSDEMDDEELDDEEFSDSFIDENEEIEDRYSMSSQDKLLDEEEEEINKSKTKRKSRIIAKFSSDSEEEAPMNTQKPPEKTQKSEKGRKSLPNIEESDKVQESDKKARKSLPNINAEKAQSPLKAPIESAKKSSKSKIQSDAEKALSDVEKALSDAEKALSDVEKAQSPLKSHKKSAKKNRKSIRQHEEEKALSDAEKALSDAEKALSDAEMAHSSLKALNKSAKKNRKSNAQEDAEKAQELSEKAQSPTQAVIKSAKKGRNSNAQEDAEKAQSATQAVKKSAKKSLNLQDDSSDISSCQNSFLNKSDTSSKETSLEDVSKRSKRKRENDFEGSATKRFRGMTANESEALHMDDHSNLVDDDAMEVDESEQPVNEVKKKKKKVVENEEQPTQKSKNKEVDFNAILERCNEYMEKTKEEKRAKMALKKERKAKKLQKKLQDKAVQTQDSLDSTGENKENAEKKKKKKNKLKKQPAVDDFDDGKKEEMSEKLDKIQQKLELKKQRKKERKLARLAEENAEAEESAKNVVEKKNTEKKLKKVEIQEPGSSKSENKKEKVLKIQEDPVEEVDETKKKLKKNKAIEKQAEEVKKSKKQVEPEAAPKNDRKRSLYEVSTDEYDVAEKTKKLKKQTEASTIDKKKSKKRSIYDVSTDENAADVVEKPKAKKKLKILMDVENPSQVPSFKNSLKQNNTNVETVKPSSNLTSKLNKVIPKGLGNEAEHVPKKKRKVVVEEKVPIKRPVWTTCGTFMEEPTTPPYVFKATKYKSVDYGTSAAAKSKVVIFSAQKSSKPVADHKMQAVMKKNKNRDKSIKNLKNLM